MFLLDIFSQHGPLTHNLKNKKHSISPLDFQPMGTYGFDYDSKSFRSLKKNFFYDLKMYFERHTYRDHTWKFLLRKITINYFELEKKINIFFFLKISTWLLQTSYFSLKCEMQFQFLQILIKILSHHCLKNLLNDFEF